MNVKETNSLRKKEHLGLLLGSELQSVETRTGLEQYYFVHQALPELDLSAVDASTTLFGKPLRAPLLISPMVGGIQPAARINRNLAEAGQSLGIAMGVGSQRCALEDPATAHTYRVRDVAPDILLFANIGAVQLNYGFGVDECLRAVEMIDADGLVLHLNPLQEALQMEGNTNFAGLLAKIEGVCGSLALPVIAKEVGFGISTEVARRLAEAGVAAIDVAGAGGTSWSMVEGRRRSQSECTGRAAAFDAWGIPTAESIRLAQRGAPGLSLIASGGIRTGVDAAKAIALGAHVAGIAAPLLRAANESPEAVAAVLGAIIEELRIAMFCVGACNTAELHNSPLLVRRT